MASQKEEVISRVLLKRSPWDAIDREFEKLIPFDSAVDHAEELSRQIHAGEATAHQIIHDEKRVGVVVSRVDTGRVREFVIVAVYCNAPTPLSHDIQAACEALARAEKCAAMRFHTVRPAAAHLAAEQHGYRLTEIILRKPLA